MLSLSAFAAEPPRGKPFWLKLKETKFTALQGATRADVLKDAIALLDNEDPELRDDIGYGLALQWVYRDQVLTPEEQTAFATALLTRLEDKDKRKTVLGRSFAALSLSMIAAAEVKTPKLDTKLWSRLVFSACEELESETDLRGHDPKLGWIHATAHTSDLLKFLARDSRLTPVMQQRIVTAISKRLEKGDTFAWGEDERLAAVLRSLAVRKDVEKNIFEPWVIGLGVRWNKLWDPTQSKTLVQPANVVAPRGFDRAEFARLNSTKQVIRAVLVALPEGDPNKKRLEEVLVSLM
ncbi:MAG: DUF2785 domain-containing protein [Archangium sp.]|nr:DUF2785 domain-containing protein [Archangium sp.]